VLRFKYIEEVVAYTARHGAAPTASRAAVGSIEAFGSLEANEIPIVLSVMSADSLRSYEHYFHARLHFAKLAETNMEFRSEGSLYCCPG